MFLFPSINRVAFEAKLRRIVNQMPQENRQTLAFLVLHLQNVSDSALTQMNASNLAKCLGPSIVGTYRQYTSTVFRIVGMLRVR